MTEPRHATVLGAGVVGVSRALDLQRAGFPVTIDDPKDPGDEASANAGILSAASVATVKGMAYLSPSRRSR